MIVCFLLGNGSEIDPVRIFITSLNLLKNADTTKQNFQAIFHLDGTYRITLNKFPLSVLGRSDMNRKFFPIALALLSRETADDILAFLLALTIICRHFRINFVVKYGMINAAPEDAKAIHNQIHFTRFAVFKKLNY